jgi:hypothetical protein
MKRAIAIGLLALCACSGGNSKLDMGHPPLAPSYLKDLPGEIRNDIPVNYTQAAVGVINVPNLLVSAKGKRIETADDWLGTRRPEIRQLLIDNQFGVPPSVASGRRPAIQHAYSEDNIVALNGTALRSQSTVSVTTDLGSHTIDVVHYLPAKATGRVPMVLMVNFSPTMLMVDDTGIKETDGWDAGKRIPGREARVIAKQDIAPFLARGYGVALVHYAQIEPDFDGGSSLGLRRIYGPVNEANRKADEAGAIATWAEGLSIVREHLALNKYVDGDRIALYGISRLGKAALWAGANDLKFAAVIAVCSGEGGGALSRRNYGETIGHVAAAFPYWFSPRWNSYGPNPSASPVDAHMIMAMIAPRPLMIIAGETDAWSDPYGEFLAARLASPVYRLFDKGGVDGLPPLDVATQHDLVYMMHAAGHGPAPQDTPAILGFLDRHFHAPAR